MNLFDIQQRLKAPKGQLNSFGGYKYRSCEDILEAVKPILKEARAYIRLVDELENIGDRYYVKATANLHIDKDVYSTSAYAREQETKKGMDEAQITGSASSYARKYALSGLLAIDEGKDADSMDNTKEGDPLAEKQEAHEMAVNEYLSAFTAIRKGINSDKNKDLLEAVAVYYSLPDEVKTALALAPSKGGQWTTKEYAFLKSNEWAAAKNEYYQKKEAA